jgi:hypothetical protein
MRAIIRWNWGRYLVMAADPAVIAFCDAVALGAMNASMERGVAQLWLAVASSNPTSEDFSLKYRLLPPRRVETPTQSCCSGCGPMDEENKKDRVP